LELTTKQDLGGFFIENPILSICIPTYNRDTILYNLLNKLIKCPSKEIEIVVSDNASKDKTKELVGSIKDPRIKYYRNKKNLGFDANLLKLVDRANGDFLFFTGDDDDIEDDIFPWIVDIIKKNSNLSLIIGSSYDKRFKEKRYFKKFNNEIYKAGFESLINIGFNILSLPGLVIKKASLNLISAKKFIGCTYIQQVLMIQAMLRGETLCASKVFWSLKSGGTNILLFKSYCAGLTYSHPLSRLSQLEDRIDIINDLLNHIPEVQNILLNQVKLKIGERIALIITNNLEIFLTKLYIITKILLKMKVLKSSIFWKTFITNFIKSLLSRNFLSKYKNKILK
jgi:glycosyltransferase involved in cell wall biosynthesis